MATTAIDREDRAQREAGRAMILAVPPRGACHRAGAGDQPARTYRDDAQRRLPPDARAPAALGHLLVYEGANRNRSTVTSRAGALQESEPFTGYDDLTGRARGRPTQALKPEGIVTMPVLEVPQPQTPDQPIVPDAPVTPAVPDPGPEQPETPDGPGVPQPSDPGVAQPDGPEVPPPADG